jgi:hypothetical protein
MIEPSDNQVANHQHHPIQQQEKKQLEAELYPKKARSQANQSKNLYAERSAHGLANRREIPI